MKDFRNRLESKKRAATLHLLFKCARILNEQAVRSLPTPPAGKRPTTSHLSLFAHIDLETGTRVTTLAERLGISKQAVSQLVDELEAMKVIEKTPDPQDGRAKRVHFTELGKKGMLDGLGHLQSLERQLVKQVGKETVDGLREALLTLHDHLEDSGSNRD